MLSFTEIIVLVLVICIFIVSIRLIIGPTIWDRLLVLNVLTTKVILVTVGLTLYFDVTFDSNIDFLDIGITYALLGFTSTVLIAKFIERKEHL